MTTAMLPFIFSSDGFMPHGHCYLWTPELLWTYVVSDALIGISYMSIPVALIVFLKKRQDIPFHWMFVMFSVFIFACGTTHFISIWTIWRPDYWLDALMKALTATTSAATAVLLWPLLPQAQRIPSTTQLQHAIAQLEHEVGQRKITEQALRESELRWKFALEGSGDGVWDMNNTTGAIIYSRRWKEMLGYADDEIGNSFADFKQLIHPDDKKAAVAAFTDYIEGRTSFCTNEHRLRCRDGSWKWVLNNGVVVSRDSNGSPLRTIGTSKDVSERKLAEADLLHMVLEASPDAMLLVGGDGGIRFANRAAETTFGYPAKELTGLNVDKLVPQPARGDHVQLRKAFGQNPHARSMVANGDITAARRDGSAFPVEISLSPIRLNGQEIVIANIQDVTQRKKTEEAIKRLALVAQKTTAAVIITGTDGKIEWVNDTFTVLTGYAPSEALGRKPGDFLQGANTDPATISQMRDCIAQQVGFGIEIVNYRKDGSAYWVGIKVDPVFDQHGRLECFIAVQNEITARRKIASDLLASRERLSSIFNAVAEGIVVQDKDTKIIECNVAAENILGLTADQLTGITSYDPRWRATLEDGRPFSGENHPTAVSFRTGQSVRGVIAGVHKPDGTLVWLSINAEPIRYDKGNVELVVCSFIDITARRKTDQALRQSQQDLRELAAHQERIKEEERKRIAQEIHDELGAMLTGIKAYVSVSIDRAEGTGLAPDPLLTDASVLADTAIETVRRVITELRPSVLDQLGVWAALEWYAEQVAERTGMTCTCTIGDEIAMVSFDPERSTMLFRIVQESLTNVVRHARASQVTIRVQRDAGSVVVEIQDNGIGIDAERLLNRESWGVVGMHERARYCGCELKINGTPGRGTVVTVRLPLEMAYG